LIDILNSAIGGVNTLGSAKNLILEAPVSQIVSPRVDADFRSEEEPAKMPGSLGIVKGRSLSERTRRPLHRITTIVRIAEIFQSVQGEGEFAGIMSVFVRTTGCNLRCWFCDTPYTSFTPEGPQRSWQDVLNDVLAYDSEHVVLTGGEPLLQAEIVPLARALRENRRIVTVETAGTVYRPVESDLMSISPKLSNSLPIADTRWIERHERDRDRVDVMQKLMLDSPYQLKFVVDQPSDLDEIVTYLKTFPEIANDRVWLMPQGIQQEALVEKGNWLAPAAERLGYRFCPRRHIEMYGNLRGT
jgi:7-carboxy-7-deazaguanine synthase